MPLLFGDDTFFDKQVKLSSPGGGNSFVHVLVHSTSGDDDPNDQPVQCVRPFQLTDRLWLCRLPKELADIVFQACESPGVPDLKAFRQYGQLYTIALFAGSWAPGQISSWDAYGEIAEFVTFSQLVHPTSIGFGNTARLTFGPDGGFMSAEPGPCRGITEEAFVIRPNRNWISEAECEWVKNLLADSKLKSLPDRVARANWNVQHAAYQFFFEVRALLMVSGLEALLNTRDDLNPKTRGPGTGKQFKNRTEQLAGLVNVSFTQADAEAVWEHRSDVVHGRDPWASLRGDEQGGRLRQPPELTKDNETVRQYLRAEHLLRATVLKCLTDQQFAAIFASDDSVKNALPI